MQKHEFSNATLICADVREALPTVRGADLLCTDPPYRLTSGGRPMHKNGKPMSGVFNKALYDNGGEIVPCDIEWNEWPALAFAALAADADAYIMANDKNLQAAINETLAAGFSLHNILVWDKVTATANGWYMKNCEFSVYAWKGRARMINDCGSKQLLSLPNSKVSKHPTEKPVALMAHYITNSTDAGQVVLDPFMGSGTTGVAAIQCGRRFVGIEKNPRFFDMACSRVERAREQPQLFGPSRARNVDKKSTLFSQMEAEQNARAD